MEVFSKVEAQRMLKAKGCSDLEIRAILTAKGGPKGANLEPGTIYYLKAEKTLSGKPELFLTYTKHSYPDANGEVRNFFNGAACLTATARDEQNLLVEARTAVGAPSIRKAHLGEPLMTLEEANQMLLAECERRLAEQADEQEEG